MTDPREDRLPKWARALLKEERRLREDAEHKLAEHLETVEPTRVQYGDYDNPLYIPDHYGLQTVRFDLAHKVNGHLYDTINVGLRKDSDDVRYLDINGGRGLVIQPTASNWIRLALSGG